MHVKNPYLLTISFPNLGNANNEAQFLMVVLLLLTASNYLLVFYSTEKIRQKK